MASNGVVMGVSWVVLDKNDYKDEDDDADYNADIAMWGDASQLAEPSTQFQWNLHNCPKFLAKCKDNFCFISFIQYIQFFGLLRS